MLLSLNRCFTETVLAFSVYYTVSTNTL